jgi:hypothetical protein
LFFLLRRRLHRQHPAFFFYILAAIVQSVVTAVAYAHWGPQSVQAWNVAWGAQAGVICARWIAVTEIAKKILNGYSGIWALTSRILFCLCISVLVYSVAFSQGQVTLLVLNADRAVELSVAAFIVLMFLFARYYRLPITELERVLAIGFCLYSCFHVINDSLYQNWISSLGTMWNYLDIWIYTASLILWLSAVRTAFKPRMVMVQPALSPEKYGELSEKLNSRLNLLNERLNHLLRSKDSRS